MRNFSFSVIVYRRPSRFSSFPTALLAVCIANPEKSYFEMLGQPRIASFSVFPYDPDRHVAKAELLFVTFFICGASSIHSRLDSFMRL